MDPTKTKEVREVESYAVSMDDVPAEIHIMDKGDYVMHYNVKSVIFGPGTALVMNDIKKSLVREVSVETSEILDPRLFEETMGKFLKRAKERVRGEFRHITDEQSTVIATLVISDMMKLGEMEYLLADDNLEEIVVNNSIDPIWVYHKKYGWLKTNIRLQTEEAIEDCAAKIGRQIGREITALEPLLDAHLMSGDRVNATLFPVSTEGNTITIRRFSRTPWTMVHMIRPEWNTISADASAFIWLAMENELSMLVSGGTGSGKTSLLNATMPFFPPNQRILTLEDTRELNLPDYLHWVPLVTRPPNPRGGGEVSMLDLMINALRMRPDRIVVGEVRAKRETEIMFEAMHTGHSTYASFHAERAGEVVERITNPPMSIPGTVLGSLHLICIQYRNRRTGVRRTFEIVELVKKKGGGIPELNRVFMWDPHTDSIKQVNPSIRVRNELETFVGMAESEVKEELYQKSKILNWLLEHNVMDINSVGRVIAEYYRDKSMVWDMVEKGKKPEELL